MRLSPTLLACALLAGCTAPAAESATASESASPPEPIATSGGDAPVLPPAMPPDRIAAFLTRAVSYTDRGGVEVGVHAMGDMTNCFVTREGQGPVVHGGRGEERCMGVTQTPDGHAVVVGGTTSDSVGGWDAFVASFGPDGAVAWEHRLGSARQDYGHDIASRGDRIYIAGTTGGALPGQEFSGSTFQHAGPDVSDAFVAAYDLSGAQLWLHQFGTPEAAEGRIGAEEAKALSIGEDGSVYVVGMTSGALFGERSFGVGGEAYIAKFRPDGTREWARLLGRRSEATDVLATSDGIVVVGRSNVFTEGTFVASFSSSGEKQWEHWKTPEDGDALEEGLSVAELRGHIFVLTQRGQEQNDRVVQEGFRVLEASESGLRTVVEGPAQAWALSPRGEGLLVVGNQHSTSALWAFDGNQLQVYTFGEP